MLPTSCNKCGRIGKSLCDVCKTQYNNRRRSQQTRAQRGYDNEYDRNRKLMIEDTWRYQLPCVLCGKGFDRKSDITAEHVIPLRIARDNSRANLQPAHSSCNSAWQKSTAAKLYDNPNLRAV